MNQLLCTRHSCRAFRSDPVPESTIRQILSMAQCTATWCNTQPWQIIITQPAATARLGRALYKRASDELPTASNIPYPREYRGVYLQRRRSTGFGLHDAVGIKRGDHEGRRRQMLDNFRFFDAPHMALITSDEALGPYGVMDCGGYIANFLLAAHSAGIGAVAQAAIARDSAYLHEFFNLSNDRFVVAEIAFGLPDESHPVNSFQVDRASIDEAVDWVSE
ncbi:nitroreductase [Roseovarius sp. HI0049]|nr:nitroreductase [Roseovarius sp. HI0049]